MHGQGPHIPRMDQTLPVPIADTLSTDIAALARRYHRANGPVIRLVNRFGGQIEAQLSVLPAGLRDQIETRTTQALQASYGLAGRLPDVGQQGPLFAAVVSGAAGGAGGLATSLAELPVTVTLFLNAIRAVARDAGFDPTADDIRLECLQVFAAGSPLADDDGVNTSFLAVRLALTGASVQKVIAAVAPRLAIVLGQKLAAQALPVLGALSGAALNAAFLGYYREMARVRFGLIRLAQTHGDDRVQDAFHQAVTLPPILRA